MALPNSGIIIPRQSVVGMENEWSKMFDPTTESPVTRERIDVPNLSTAPGANPRANPVPAFMEALGLKSPVSNFNNTVRRVLYHGNPRNMWDNKQVTFFEMGDPDVSAASGGTFPAPTIRVPRGTIFHGATVAGPPPHTIHWHGIEPTPMNDGVGHCSMELGSYTYQWQPNFIGSYFYHCHRNTMQHFEFGLYGFLIIEPPDAYDQQNPAQANYAGGYPRRTAANLTSFSSQFPGFVGGDLATGGPHAMTVPYDAEALWVLDDRDSRWSDLMSNDHATFPRTGINPGVDDQFFKGDFHDFNPDYFFVTGLNFDPRVNGVVVDPKVGTIPNSFLVPPDINSGVTGMQVPINASVNQTVLARVLCGSYVGIKVTFPVDVVIIAFDGRALGVPPFGQYNQAFKLNKNTPFELSTARRFDALIRETSPFSGFATIEYIDVRGGATLFTGRIPINIS